MGFSRNSRVTMRDVPLSQSGNFYYANAESKLLGVLSRREGTDVMLELAGL